MRRRPLIAVIALGIVVFLVVSALLTRVLSVDGAERSAVTGLVEAEARGAAGEMLAQLDGCAQDDRCRRRVDQDAISLRRPGRVSIIQIQTSSGFSLSGTLGNARVAWVSGSSLPVVQCVRVHRAGNVLSGLRVELLAITPRLKSDAVCPPRF